MKDLLVLLAHLLTTLAKLLGPGGVRIIVELKQRNPRFKCPRIAQQINKAFGVNIDEVAGRALIRLNEPQNPTCYIVNFIRHPNHNCKTSLAVVC